MLHGGLDAETVTGRLTNGAEAGLGEEPAPFQHRPEERKGVAVPAHRR